MTDQYLLERRNKMLGLASHKEEKKSRPISRMSEKRKADEEDKKLGDAWFKARHREMTGKCLVCGEPTCKGMDEYKCSIAHLFAKNKHAFPSIKWHPDNWIELDFYGNSCHTNFDNNILTFEDLKHTQAWDVIVRKFKILYPLMSNREQGRVPAVLLNELNETK